MNITAETNNNYIDFSHFDVCSEEHQMRKSFHQRSGDSLAITIRKLLSSNNKKYLNSIHQNVLLAKAILLANSNSFVKASDYTDIPFGAVSTLEKAGCLAFLSYHILLFSKIENLSIEDLTNIISTKGYRMWKFENDKKSLNIPAISLPDLKEIFSEKLSSCSSLDEVYEILGNPVGIGGSMFFIDNLIEYFSSSKTQKYQLTRLWHFDEILNNLSREIPVPVRVNNSIYLNDPSKEGGHYVLLVGIDQGYAFIVDSNFDKTNCLTTCPIRNFLEAVIHNPGLIAAWNISNLF